MHYNSATLWNTHSDWYHSFISVIDMDDVSSATDGCVMGVARTRKEMKNCCVGKFLKRGEITSYSWKYRQRDSRTDKNEQRARRVLVQQKISVPCAQLHRLHRVRGVIETGSTFPINISHDERVPFFVSLKSEITRRSRA